MGEGILRALPPLIKGVPDRVRRWAPWHFRGDRVLMGIPVRATLPRFGTAKGTSEGFRASESGDEAEAVYAVSRTRALAVGLLTLAVVAGACGSSPQGTVQGVFYGLAKGSADRPVRTGNGGLPSPGSMRVGGPTGVYFATAGADGHFTLNVPPRTYLVSGRGPGETGGISGCQAPNVDVTPGKTTRIALTCTFR